MNMNVEYDDLMAGAINLKQTADEIEQSNQRMMQQVTNLFDAWEGQAKPQYQADFESVSKNVGETLEVSKKLSDAVYQYASEIKAVEEAHKNTKIQ